MIIESWFPTLIGIEDNPKHGAIEKNLVNHCNELKNSIESGGKSWVSKNTYNTSDGAYDLFSDTNFTILNDWILEKVKNFAIELGMDSDLDRTDAWFNVYKRNDFQEYHTHSAILSTIYFLKAGPESARVFFKSPRNQMFHAKHNGQNLNTHGTVNYKPMPGRLLIFTSDIEHCVERHDSDEERITLSYNFKQK